MNTKRNTLLDILKGIAIIGVILYHSGLSKYGYLGVEIFLVVAGYLTTASIMRHAESGNFSYRSFVGNRLIRIWPLLLIVTVTTFVLGYLWMLPHDFKLHCESVASSSIFVNNVVQMITSGNYWDTSNELKPLMHTWYIGIIMQFYLIFPVIFLLTKRFAKKIQVATRKALWWIFACSLLLYTLPILSDAQNFYLLPSRLFEFAAGGLIAVTPAKEATKKNGAVLAGLCLIAAILLLFINTDFNLIKTRLLCTVGIATLIIAIVKQQDGFEDYRWLKWLAMFGMASFSLFLWHQPIFAFYRYVFNYNITAGAYVVIIALSIIIGLLSYFTLEQPIGRMAKCHKMGG